MQRPLLYLVSAPKQKHKEHFDTDVKTLKGIKASIIAMTIAVVIITIMLMAA